MISSTEIKLLELMYGFKFDNLSLSLMQRKQINQLKKYMYSETMPRTFTKKIFENLIASGSIDNGTLIYLDFNRIGANNAIYGKEEVTKAMTRSIDAIISILPKGTIPIRMGGDEFIFIIPDKKLEDTILNQINSLVEKHSKKGKIVDGISVTSVIGYIDETHNIYDTYCTLSQECAKNKKRSITKILEILRAFNLTNSDTIIYCLLSILESAKNWVLSEKTFDIDKDLDKILTSITTEENQSQINAIRNHMYIDEELEELLTSITTSENQNQINAIRNHIYIDKELEEILTSISSSISEDEINAIRSIIISTKQRILENIALKKNAESFLASPIEIPTLPSIQNGEDLVSALKSFTISSWGIPKIGPFLDSIETTIPKNILSNPEYKIITIEITHLKASNTRHGIIKTDKHLQEIINLITQTFGEKSFYASLKGGKILLFTSEETEKINSIIDEIQDKYLPFGLEYYEYQMPEEGWSRDTFLKIKEYFENNGNAQVKSLDITDSSIQAIIIDFFTKYIENLEDKVCIKEDRTSTIINDMIALYLMCCVDPSQLEISNISR